jgi:hypothetical protein
MFFVIIKQWKNIMGDGPVDEHSEPINRMETYF